MRAPVNLMLFFILLFSGGEYIHATTHVVPVATAHNFDKKHHVKLTNQDSGIPLIEDAELTVDEEYHSSDDLYNGDISRFLNTKVSLLDSWYLDFSQQFILDDLSKRIKIFAPFSGESNPIYIRQQVLRI